ncbi:MAG TPA: DUF401 family protein [Firmicutes bacterium]|nr:DUF401 family protein [Bacillota bacterium]
MSELLRLIVVCLLMVVFLRRNFNLGLVMITAAAIFGVSFGMGPASLGAIALKSATSPDTLDLIVALVLISFLEHAMRRAGLMQRMVGALNALISDRRIIMAALPAFLGLLPSAGGARFSAPLVHQVTAGLEIAPERKAFINYWYRHIWECVMPIYPSVIVAGQVLGLPLDRLIMAMLPMVPVTIIAGIVPAFKGMTHGGAVQAAPAALELPAAPMPQPAPAVSAASTIPGALGESAKQGIAPVAPVIPAGEATRTAGTVETASGDEAPRSGGVKGSGKSKVVYMVKGKVMVEGKVARMGEDRIGKMACLFDALAALGPIIAIVAGVTVLKLDIAVAVAAVFMVMIVVGRYPAGEVWSLVREAFSLNVVFLVFGVMLFRDILVSSGALNQISAFLGATGVPPLFLLFILPFLVAFSTGLGVTVPGIAFPLIMGILNTPGGINLSLAAFAFVSGFVGAMLSPAHLCLVLTVDYFKASFAEVQNSLWAPAIAVELAALVLAFL